MAVELLGFLIGWLSRHIKGVDKDYSIALAKKYNTQEPTTNPAPAAGNIDLF